MGGWFGAISQNTTLQLRGLPAVTLLGGVRPTTILCDNTVAGGAVLYDAAWMTERAYSKDSGSSRAVFPAWLGVSAGGTGVPQIRDEARWRHSSSLYISGQTDGHHSETRYIARMFWGHLYYFARA